MWKFSIQDFRCCKGLVEDYKYYRITKVALTNILILVLDMLNYPFFQIVYRIRLSFHPGEIWYTFLFGKMLLIRVTRKNIFSPYTHVKYSPMYEVFSNTGRLRCIDTFVNDVTLLDELRKGSQMAWTVRECRLLWSLIKYSEGKCSLIYSDTVKRTC